MALPRESWQAIEADLLRAGWTLADIPGRVSWRAVAAMLANLPSKSAAAVAVVGERAAWSATDYLLADVVDLLRVQVWMSSEDGRRNRNRPKPTVRPGVKPKGVTYGSGQYTPQELTEMFGW